MNHFTYISLKGIKERYSSIPRQLKRREPMSPKNLNWSLTRERSICNAIEEYQYVWIGMIFRNPLIIVRPPRLNDPHKLDVDMLSSWRELVEQCNGYQPPMTYNKYNFGVLDLVEYIEHESCGIPNPPRGHGAQREGEK